MALTARQERFVQEYLIDLNATQASIRAGYSAKTAEQQGPRLLGNVGVAEAIKAAQDARSKRTQITQEYVITRLKEEAELMSEDDGTHAARIRAIELLGKHLGMFVERHEHTVLDPIRKVG